jgi:predicted enzyme related to lactoylglutathione lyase
MKSTPINYIELATSNIQTVEKFYSTVFSWKFTSYGPEYIAFENSGLEGGFYLTDKPIVNGALIVLLSDELDVLQEKILQAGGKICQETFSFPGGERFHFIDPVGNELAIWRKI